MKKKYNEWVPAYYCPKCERESYISDGCVPCGAKFGGVMKTQMIVKRKRWVQTDRWYKFWKLGGYWEYENDDE